MKFNQDKLSSVFEIAKIAVPAMLESLVIVSVAVIDTKMIAVLGDKAISAVSLTAQPKIFVLSVFFALGTALSFFVARAYGKNNREEAKEYFFSVLKIGIIGAVVLGVLLFVFARPVMELCSRQTETVELSAEFFSIIMGFMVFQVSSIILNGALRGLGKTYVTLIASLALGLVDILFNYLLIEGRYGFPRLEVTGNAIATVLGSVVALAVSFTAITYQEGFLSFKKFFAHRFKKPQVILDIKSKAGNIILENLAMRLGFLICGVIVSLFPPEDTAVYFVGMLLMNLSFACGDGLQSAAVAILGKNAGMGNMAVVRNRLRLFLKTGAIVSLILSAIYVSMSDLFFGAYFTDETYIIQGRTAVYFIASITCFQIGRIIMVAAMRAVGEMKIPRQIASVCVTIVNPLASFLLAYVLGFGITGVWQGILITQIFWGLMAFVKGSQCIWQRYRT